MARWLFNSRGQGIAFVVGDNVFSKNSKFLGKLHGNEIWNSHYVAEILADERVARKRLAPLGLKGLPGLPGLPGLKGPRLLPVGYEDLA